MEPTAYQRHLQQVQARADAAAAHKARLEQKALEIEPGNPQGLPHYQK